MQIPLMDITIRDNKLLSQIKEKINELILNSQFIGGKELETFENNFADFTKNKFCIGCANGTDAIILALKALNISNNDKVIVPTNTFIATAEAVLTVGANVVFVDCNKDDQLINIEQVEYLLTTEKNIKAVIPVHLYGQMNNIERLNEIAKKFNILIIEDASQAHGASFNNITPGQLSKAATFSFYPGKNLGAFGDAGAVVTNDFNIAMTIKSLRNHGRIDKKYDHEIAGFNMRLDTIQAAILNIKLSYLKTENQLRRDKVNIYNNLLKNVGDLILPQSRNLNEDVYYVYTIRTKFRDQLQKYLNDNGIQTGIYYPKPLHLQKAFEFLNHKKGDFPNSELQSEQILSLPLWPYITEEQITYICKTIKEFFNRCAE
jgi:dTDP-4-amino-4,6-dideoxygalactose transaminase